MIQLQQLNHNNTATKQVIRSPHDMSHFLRPSRERDVGLHVLYHNGLRQGKYGSLIPENNFLHNYLERNCSCYLCVGLHFELLELSLS